MDRIKKNVISLVLFCSLFINCDNIGGVKDSFNGRWSYIYNDDGKEYSIEFGVDNDSLTGTHCFIEGIYGNKIDCPDVNSFIFKEVSNDKILGMFSSDFSSDKINCSLVIIKDTLVLQCHSNTGFTLFEEEMKFIKIED